VHLRQATASHEADPTTTHIAQSASSFTAHPETCAKISPPDQHWADRSTLPSLEYPFATPPRLGHKAPLNTIRSGETGQRSCCSHSHKHPLLCTDLPSRDTEMVLCCHAVHATRDSRQAVFAMDKLTHARVSSAFVASVTLGCTLDEAYLHQYLRLRGCCDLLSFHLTGCHTH
jgi:hypothetical protein